MGMMVSAMADTAWARGFHRIVPYLNLVRIFQNRMELRLSTNPGGSHVEGPGFPRGPPR